MPSVGVRWVLAQSSRWSFSRRAVRLHPNRVHSGCCHSNAVSWYAVGLRPKCATEITSTPLVTTAAMNGSWCSTKSRTTDTGTGPLADQVAHLARLDPAPLGGGRVAAEDDVGRHWPPHPLAFHLHRWGCPATCGAGHGRHGVGGVGGFGFVSLLKAGQVELGVGEPVDHRPGFGDAFGGVIPNQ